MKINLKHLNRNLEITYSDKGVLDYVQDIDTNEYLMLEIKYNGSGYKIRAETFVIGGTSNVCDARYVRIMDINIFIPNFIFIVNN